MLTHTYIVLNFQHRSLYKSVYEIQRISVYPLVLYSTYLYSKRGTWVNKLGGGGVVKLKIHTFQNLHTILR